MVASNLGPIPTPSYLDSVQLMFGGASDTKSVGLLIYQESGTPTPGSKLFEATYQLTGSNSTLSIIDLSAQNLLLGAGSYRFGIQFTHDALPSVGRDTDGSVSGRNWVYSSGTWYSADTLGISGDCVLRAEVSSVPIPGAVWLLGSGLACIVGIRSRLKR